MRRLILVVDFGTSNVHINAVDVKDGTIPYAVSGKYQMMHPGNGYMELDPEEMWEKSEEGVRSIVDQITEMNDSIEAISFSFFGDNIIPVDAEGRALYRLLQCFDIRGDRQAQKLNAKLGTDHLIQKTGDACAFTSCSAKICYMLEEMEEIRGAQDIKFYSIQQYILRKLSLPDVNDQTMACTKRMVELKSGTWYEPLLKAVGIEKEQLGEIVLPSTVIGRIDSYGDVKLPNKVNVVPGAHDCDCGWLGLGVCDEKETMVGNITGTFEHFGYLADGCLNTYAAHPEWGVFSYCGPMKDTSVVLTAFETSGALLEWFMREIHGDVSKEAYEYYWKNAVFAGKNAVRVHPDFRNGRGAIEGLDLTQNKIHIFQAVIEALTLESRIMIETCERMKRGGIESVRIGGGHTKSPKWLQLKADITGKAYECTGQVEASSVGAAILAAAGSGIYENVSDAAAHMVQIKEKYEPDPEVHQVYEEIYQRYVRQRKGD